MLEQSAEKFLANHLLGGLRWLRLWRIPNESFIVQRLMWAMRVVQLSNPMPVSARFRNSAIRGIPGTENRCLLSVLWNGVTWHPTFVGWMKTKKRGQVSFSKLKAAH
jgi:hypothetical protein